MSTIDPLEPLPGLSRLSAGVGDGDPGLEAWFEAPRRTSRPPRPTSSPPSAPPIDDPVADDWFR